MIENRLFITQAGTTLQTHLKKRPSGEKTTSQ
jgi:hypothetical protein